MTSKPPRRRAPAAFTSVSVRHRYDGWTPEKQLGFVNALAESGCVAEACKAVGMAREGAYALRARIDGQSFRLAWDAALDFAIRRLTDEVFSRALNGVAVPHFYKGEQVGEHRRYDNRLSMFLMRYHNPLRYARSLDQMVYDGHPEGAAIGLAKARDRLADDAYGSPPDEAAEPAPAAPWTAALPSSAAAIADGQTDGKPLTPEELKRRYYACMADEDADEAMRKATSRGAYERARTRYEIAVINRTGKSPWRDDERPEWEDGG